MTRATLSAFVSGLGVLLVASAAQAQGKGGEFGQQGQIIVGADRLFPFVGYDSVKLGVPVEDTATEKSSTVTSTQTAVSFLWGASPTFYNVPRLGADFVVAPNITVGGDLVLFFTVGGSTTTHTEFNDGHTTDTTTDAPSLLTWGIAPRAGYIMPLSDMMGLWLRAGPAYYRSSSKKSGTLQTGGPQGQTDNYTETTTKSLFAVNLEPLFFVTPVPHFGFHAGPVIDVPITGSLSSERVDNVGGTTTDTTTSYSYSELHVGISAGLFGWF